MRKWIGLALVLAMALTLFGGGAAFAEETEEISFETTETVLEGITEEDPAENAQTPVEDAESPAEEAPLPDEEPLAEELPSEETAPEEAPQVDGAASKTGYNRASTYLAFGSDRHGVTTAIATAMSGMPDAVSYVCLIGDMVNGTKSYNTSTILQEAQAVFGADVRVDITYGDHDKNCNDDAGIFNRKSGLIETGYKDGQILYYVYGINMDDVTSAASAKTEADKFMKWVDEACRDTHIPIIVYSHVPLHYAREDNPGGEYWNEALNYAATGFATTDSGKTIIRNVIFFHAHNHTKPASETRKTYNYTPGTSGVEIQCASGTKSSTVYYSYLTAGYMGLESEGGGAGIKSSHATLLEITDTQLILTQYPANSPAGAAKLQTVNRIAPSAPEIIPGDTNHDGHADAFDAALILQFAVELSAESETIDSAAADADGDNIVTARDAAWILHG